MLSGTWMYPPGIPGDEAEREDNTQGELNRGIPQGLQLAKFPALSPAQSAMDKAAQPVASEL